MFSDFVDRTDVGVVECGCSTSLAAKPLRCLWVSRQFIGQKFHSHKAPKLGVFCFVNNTHSTAAQLLNNAVVRNDLVDHAWQDSECNIGDE